MSDDAVTDTAENDRPQGEEAEPSAAPDPEVEDDEGEP